MAWESDEVGVGEFTENKQAEFRALMRMIMSIVAGKARRGETPHVFYYFDLYAGTGWAKGAAGSVIIAIEEAEKAGLLLRGWFFEKDAETAEALRANLKGLPGNLHVIEGDNSLTVPQMAGAMDLRGTHQLARLPGVQAVGLSLYPITRRQRDVESAELDQARIAR